jgi:hypothetical protein
MTWVVWAAAAFVVVDVIAALVLWWGARTAAPEPFVERRVGERRTSAQAWSGPERRRQERRRRFRFLTPLT